ncbi:MAG: acetoin utilization protein AcuC [Nitrososphaerota archaeon]
MGCRVGVAWGEELLDYSFPFPHPFRRDRAIAFYQELSNLAEHLANSIIAVKPEQASLEDVLLFHEAGYVDFVKRKSEDGRGYLDYGDTPAFKGCYEASLYVVGATLKLVKLILAGEIDHGFNPIGGLHHARRSSAAGFCIFNDAAIAIEYLLKREKMPEILYVDIDAHHGDGVFYSFYDDGRVRILDVHQNGRTLYPGTGFPHERGAGSAVGTKLNINLLPGAGVEEFREAWNEMAEEFLAKSRPSFIILQAGADGLAGDPLTSLNYTEEVHVFVASRLHELAHERCGGRLLALGGGGYDLSNVAKAWTAVVRALANRS